MIIIDVAWLSLGIAWLVKFYISCPVGKAKDIMLGKFFNYYIFTHTYKPNFFLLLILHTGLVVCNWVIILFILVTIWCTFDAAGRSWVKMKKYQRSMRESESRFNYKRSGSMNRNWRQRFVFTP